jgi:hypothetical protein
MQEMDVFVSIKGFASHRSVVCCRSAPHTHAVSNFNMPTKKGKKVIVFGDTNRKLLKSLKNYTHHCQPEHTKQSNIRGIQPAMA